MIRRKSSALGVLLLVLSLLGYVRAQAHCTSANFCTYLNDNGDKIRIRMEGPTSYGYMAFGINAQGSSGMNGAEIFVALRNTDGTIDITHRYASSESEPSLLSSQSYITKISNATGTNINGKFVATFDRVRDPPSGVSQIQSISSTSSQSAIWAFGTTAGSFSDHRGNRGSFSATLLSSSSAYSSSSTSSASGSTQTGTSSGSGSSNSGGSSSGSSGSSSSSSGSESDQNDSVTTDDLLRILHGVLMFLAWGVLAPLAVSFARYLKQWRFWFYLHAYVFGIGILLFTVAGFGIIFYVTGYGNHFKINTTLDGSHRYLGLVVIILTVLQVVLGAVINRLFKPDRTKIPWHDKLHWYLGRVCILASLVNTGTGVMDYSSRYALYGDISIGWYIALVVWIVLVVVAFIILEIKVGQQHHQEEEHEMVSDKIETLN